MKSSEACYASIEKLIAALAEATNGMESADILNRAQGLKDLADTIGTLTGVHRRVWDYEQYKAEEATNQVIQGGPESGKTIISSKN